MHWNDSCAAMGVVPTDYASQSLDWISGIAT